MEKNGVELGVGEGGRCDNRVKKDQGKGVATRWGFVINRCRGRRRRKREILGGEEAVAVVHLWTRGCEARWRKTLLSMEMKLVIVHPGNPREKVLIYI
ncbi:hypothetical protein BHE74_00035081 [Ensete ventricosum]|nr:hypothetical protein GW17_00045506 [Ensete ventricosum]RWW58074.1 hypothetical protein BHE74_00035081 [Ensete ventricosum]